VIIDGKLQGKTPLSVELRAGTHTVRLENPGYSTINYQLNIDREGTSSLFHTLALEH
jgi:hypothetical protein